MRFLAWLDRTVTGRALGAFAPPGGAPESAPRAVSELEVDATLTHTYRAAAGGFLEARPGGGGGGWRGLLRGRRPRSLARSLSSLSRSRG